MAYDVILLTFSKPIAAVLKQRSMWQQMSGSRRAGYTFDSHSRTQRKGYDKMGQVRAAVEPWPKVASLQQSVLEDSSERMSMFYSINLGSSARSVLSCRARPCRVCITPKRLL